MGLGRRPGQARSAAIKAVRLWRRLRGVPVPPGASTRPIAPPTGIPAALPGVPLTLAVVGDFGRCHEADAECEAEKAVARLVDSWAPAYVLTTGDNNYPAGAAATMTPNLQPYRAYIEAGRFLPALGNHDWGDHDWPRAYLAQFRPPGNGRYYHVALGDLGLWVLDSDEHEPDGIDAGSAQARWLRAGLAASPIPVNVVVLHHPPYNSGAHGSSARLRWPFAAWGADAVLSGHEHSYERLAVESIPYIVNGSGGAALRGFGQPLTESRVRDDAHHGALRVLVGDEGTVIEFWSVGGGQRSDDVTLRPAMVRHTRALSRPPP
jgi:tartrate-resistant acid phosphatase type 5